MTAVHWIIQENQSEPLGGRGMVEALAAAGHVPHLVRLERGAGVPPLVGLPDGAPIVCHGPGFITRAWGHPRLQAGLFFDPAPFRWSAFRAGWGEAMLAADGQVVTLAEALDRLADGSTAFIRPDADSKAFDGAVHDAETLVRATGALPDAGAMPVVMAAPVRIDGEWRFFIVGGEIAACSEYRCWGEPSTEGAVPYAAIDLAADLAARWSPAPVYCLDLAATETRIGVVEANCFNAARFYGADGDAILRAVNAHVLSRHRLAG
jgi:hypothetical protein